MNRFRLKEVRKKHKLSQLEVATILNVKRGTYASWECENDIIPSKQLYKLATYYKISTDYILGLTNDKTSVNSYKLDLNNIGNNLKDLRIKYNLTQKQIAESIGINQSTWWAYEKGKHLITTNSLIALNKLYECHIDDILKIKELVP